MYRVLLYVLTTLAGLNAGAQFILGLPEISNYSKQAYRGGAQTRQIAQDQSGLLYFANDEGVLTFNGARWRIYPLPNKSLVRCLKFGPDNNLYVGGQDEVGYFSPAPNGTLRYRSLKDRLPPEARSFADVWELCFVGDEVFFQTTDRIYRIGKGRTTVFPDEHWRFMGKVDNELIAQSNKNGLLRFRDGAWQPFGPKIQTSLPPGYFATSLTRIGRDSVLLTTLKDGLFLLTGAGAEGWHSPALAEIATRNISSSCLVNEAQIAVGTNLGGCYILDKKGGLVQHFGRKEGLQDNSILTIFLDQQRNLWFGLHNGIDFIPYNNAVKHLGAGPLSEGAGFSSHIFRNRLYFGTSIGLFHFPLDNPQDLSTIRAVPTPVKNSTGEAWNLSEVSGQLLMGHNEGAFWINNDEAVALDKTSGYWNFQPLPANPPSALIVAGTYRGLAFYDYKSGRFDKAPDEAALESARFVVTAGNKIWFSHPYKGIYAVTRSAGETSCKKYSPKEGVASANNNYLFKIKNELLLTAESGVFRYNPAKDRFEPSAFYNTHLPKFPIRYLKEDKEGNVWFVFEKKVGVLDLTTDKPQVIYFPELTNKFVAGFEHINPVDKNNILIGGENGFYHINYSRYKDLKYSLQVSIGGVTAINQRDSLLFGGYGSSVFSGASVRPPQSRLGHQFNSLRFEFASAVYGQLANIEYSYCLQGFDRGWSAFDRKTEKDYTNLPPGNYVFRVKARNNLGNESAVSEYAFTLLPPWYKTTAAYVLYLLAFAVGVYGLYRYQQKKFKAQQRRHEEEQRRLQYLHQLELEKNEKEIVELRNAKLEAEIRSKNTELASTAMHLVQKSDVLLKIKEQMTKLKAGAVTEDAADLKKILKTLNEENKMEEQWQQFSLHFDTVHRNFLTRLKTRHTDLTPNEQKLCAYLKMNLTTKEIAQLMNITPRGVEISRYRLRKKLGVPTGTHLFNFLDAIE